MILVNPIALMPVARWWSAVRGEAWVIAGARIEAAPASTAPVFQVKARMVVMLLLLTKGSVDRYCTCKLRNWWLKERYADSATFYILCPVTPRFGHSAMPVLEIWQWTRQSSPLQWRLLETSRRAPHVSLALVEFLRNITSSDHKKSTKRSRSADGFDCRIQSQDLNADSLNFEATSNSVRNFYTKGPTRGLSNAGKIYQYYVWKLGLSKAKCTVLRRGRNWK